LCCGLQERENLLMYSLKNPKGKKSYNIQTLGASTSRSLTSSVP
jgi:hypothetical protein